MATFTVIAGGHRPSGESPRIARWTAARLEKRGHTVHVVDLSDLSIPMWDEGMWGVDGLKEKWATHWAPINEKLKASDGFVVVSPEYHGMVPAALRNFFLLLGNTASSALAHKAGLIITVTATPTNGAYPVMELRGTVYKNSRVNFIPENLIIRGVQNILKDDVAPEHKGTDEYITKRADYCLDLLEDYAEALKHVRKAGRINTTDYANGM